MSHDGAVHMRRVSVRLWWTLSGLGLVIAVVMLVVFALQAPHRLDAVDKLSSVASLMVAVAGLALSAVSLRSAVRPRRSPTLPEPTGRRQSWNIPPPVGTFVGREGLLEELSRATGRVVLHGPPGVGKSQVALAWAHQHGHRCAIGWRVRVGDAVTAAADLAELARVLGVGDDDAARAASNAVTELGKRSDWVLIFDDAPGVEAIQDWLPYRGGRVIVTSRNPSWEPVGETLSVPPLDTTLAAEFLCERARDGDAEAATQLAVELGGMPLALEQAGAYCRKSGRSLSSYLGLYRAVGGTRLLDYGAPDGATPATRTVRLAVRLAARRDPAAAQLLGLLAFLAPTGIPRDLPAAAPNVLPRPLRHAARDPVRLDHAVQVLMEAALVTADQPGQLRMHQLVQQIMRHPTVEPRWWRRLAFSLRLPGADPVAGWGTRQRVRTATRLLTAALPGDPYDPVHFHLATTLTTHAQALIQHADDRDSDTARLQTSMTTLAKHLRDLGDLEGSQRLIEQIVQTRRRLLGTEHPDTLSAMADLAAIASMGGQHDHARQLAEQVVQTRQRLLGTEHRDTLSAMDELAAILRSSGQLIAARQLIEQTLHTRQRLHGVHAPDARAAARELDAVLGDIDAVSGVFIRLAHRSQILIDRLIANLDRVERDEADPDRLSDLFQLDHLATLLRRNDETILLLAGAKSLRTHLQPAPVVDVLRAAQSEIEFFTRVQLGSVDGTIIIAASVVNDLVHLIAELMDNATQFSPPYSTVLVGAWYTTDSEAVIRIQDSGIGCSPAQLDELNERLADPPPIYANPSHIGRRTGIYIVSVLAARHGIRVCLLPNHDGGGTVAAVALPRHVQHRSDATQTETRRAG